MSSLTKDRRLIFKAPDGNRKTIRLGAKLPIKQAQGIQRHIERLIACQFDGSAPPPETSGWIAGIDITLRTRIERVGLLSPVELRACPTLSGMIEQFKARPKWKTIKPNTQKSYQRSFDCLVDYFGSDKQIDAITVADAEDFYGHLNLSKDDGGKGYAVASSNSTISTAFALMRYAVDSELLNRNPFRTLPRGTRKGNNCHVSEEVARLVLAAMTDTQQRLHFGLSRWGGLRVPSEPILMRWSDVDWERERFLVHSPKTERHEGREKRWVPMFPELVPLFDARFSEAAEGDEYVFPRFRAKAPSHPGHLLELAIRRAEVERWPRLWHSMRSTRQTELVERFPVHTVCSWLGNSIDVAATHYLKVTEQHFKEATKVAQKAARTATASGCTEGKTDIHEISTE